MSVIRVLIMVISFVPGLALAASLNVISSVPPVNFLVKQIGGDHVLSSVLIKPGRNPENDEPSPSQMKGVAKASLWFRIGLPFENRWEPVVRSINPTIKQIHLNETATTGANGEPASHRHSIDPHIWTDPVLMHAAADKIRNVLSAADSAHTDEYNKNSTRLKRKLVILDQEIKKELSPFRGRSFLVYHPAWGHFAKRYGLNQISIEHEGKTPGPRHLTELAQLAKKEKIRTIFVQKQFDKANAETLAHAIHARIVILDPLSGDYLNNMRETAKAIAESFQ